MPDLTALERAIEEARSYARRAENSASNMECIHGEAMFFMEFDRALIPGHVYSEMGLREARISGSCEYHFDRMFEPGWKDPVTGELGDTPEEEED